MFIGEYQHNLDNKGRLSIPSRFRDNLQESFILARGLDKCLTVYSLEQWEKLFRDIEKLPTTKKVTRQYIRVLTSGATECTLDSQGRIQIPAFLSAPVNIKKECVVIGANDHIEIWDQQTWQDYYKDASDSFEDVAEHLSDLLDHE